MKVPDSGHEERMLACGESWTLEGQAGGRCGSAQHGASDFHKW